MIFMWRFSFPILLTFALLALILTGCPRPMPGPAPTPAQDTDPDAGPEITCADACERASKLGCAAAEPTPKGATCLDVCSNAMRSGIITFDLACKARAVDCAAFTRCN